MKNKKSIMILGASILQLPAIENACNLDLEVIVLDMDPNAIGFKVPGVIKEVISTIDIQGAIDVAKKYNIDGVMTLATDMPMRTVAAVAKELGLVGVSDETALKATDKSVMRQSLKDAGVPVPMFYRVSNKEEYYKAIDKISMPFVVKPADSSGSRGIILVNDKNNKKVIDEAYDYSSQYSHNGIIVVEEYMSGYEVSVETLAIDGEVHVIQITDKITTGSPYFVEMGHTQPTHFNETIVESIKEVAIMANKAIGINNGPSHTEIMVTKDGPKIVEIGARLGGDCITTHLVPLSTGVNMVEACIKIALGEKPDIAHKYNRGSAIRYFQQTPGIISNILGIEEAKKLPGVKQISIVHGIGERITQINSSGSRMGFVIAEGSCAEDASINAKNAIDSIIVEEIVDGN